MSCVFLYETGSRHRAKAGSSEEIHWKTSRERKIFAHDFRQLFGRKQQVCRLPHQSLQEKDQEAEEEKGGKR